DQDGVDAHNRGDVLQPQLSAEREIRQQGRGDQDAGRGQTGDEPVFTDLALFQGHLNTAVGKLDDGGEFNVWNRSLSIVARWPSIACRVSSPKPLLSAKAATLGTSGGSCHSRRGRRRLRALLGWAVTFVARSPGPQRAL